MHTQLCIDDIADEDILFYDIESNHQYAPYATLKMIGAQEGISGEPFLIDSEQKRRWFRRKLQCRKTLKCGWNSKSFDDIVLKRHGYPVCEENSHDIMLAMKTVHPHSASFSQKFCAFDWFSDPHFPEMAIEEWAKKNNRDKWEAPKELLGPYCLHDITQLCNLFRLVWDKVVQPEHWSAYCLDISQGEPVHEMILEGGIFLDEKELRDRIATLQNEKMYWGQQAFQHSKGRVTNPNSGKQVGSYLHNEGFTLALTADGEFTVDKHLLLDLVDVDHPDNDRDSVARCTWETRRINASLKYYENYVAALQDKTYSDKANWIPVSYSISNARTRRYTSSSLFGLNFQNANEEATKVQRVPEGWLDVRIDSTQVENVTHIYESNDNARRRAYCADPDWNEYVWLCNQILGGDRKKSELDHIPSPQIPHWSIYKQFKTVKLALNFGMGVAKFCTTSGLDAKVGRRMFDLVHEACPAIHRLQRRVANDLATKGKVTDPFGHIYSGEVRMAYKVVAYLIQGCGTASLPKAQIKANWDTLKKNCGGYGVMCGTVHDEQAMRLNLKLGKKHILATLQKLMFNMTELFSPKFDNIPLRAKLYLSRTTAYDKKEVAITDKETIFSFC